MTCEAPDYELHKRAAEIYEYAKYWQSGPQVLAACYEEARRQLAKEVAIAEAEGL